MKRYFKYICLILGSLFCLIILSFSLYFNLSPFKVVLTLSREVALEGIESVVEHYYDPWTKNRKVAYTGPKGKFCPGAIDNVHALIAYLRINDLNFKTVNFSNYIPQASRFSFAYAPFDPVRRKIALEKYGLRKIWHKYKKNDFQMALALMAYVKSLWKHNTDKGFDPRHFDAFKMIELGQERRGFWCQVYAMTFVELACYLGLPARVVALSQKGYISGHAVVEVWSNIWNKWFVVDPDFNIYYLCKGVPLNAIELHKLWEKHKENGVLVVKLKPRPQGYDVETRSRHKLLEYYQYVRIDLRNDYHWNIFPRGHPAVSDENTLLWFDDYLHPILSFENKTNRYNDFYWSLDYVYVRLLPIKLELNTSQTKLVFKVLLSTETPWFYCYKVIMNGEIFELKEDSFEWVVKKGDNFLKICPKNKYSLFGTCSAIRIFVKE